MKILNQNLFRQSAFVNNQWLGSESRIKVFSPANETLIGSDFFWGGIGNNTD